MMHHYGLKMVQLARIIFSEKPLLCSCTFGPFTEQNFKENLYNGSRVMTACHVWARNGQTALNETFLEKALI